jgi:hypothetical protein
MLDHFFITLFYLKLYAFNFFKLSDIPKNVITGVAHIEKNSSPQRFGAAAAAAALRACF